MNKRIWSVILVMAMLLWVWQGANISGVLAKGGKNAGGEAVSDQTENVASGAGKMTATDDGAGQPDPAPEDSQSPSLFSAQKQTIRIWYTDEDMTDYLQKRAEQYMAAHEDVRILPVLAERAEYLENIYEASVRENADEPMPDLFLTTDDTLEKAYLMGIAVPVDEMLSGLDEQHFPAVSLRAVTCRGKQVAYPLSYETAVFLYNKTYLETMAKAHNEALSDIAQAQAAEAQTAEMLANGEEPEVAEDGADVSETEQGNVTADDLIPKNFEAILDLAENYDAPEGLESILKWDVTDVFYNYFFAGNYINVGGECGDDKTQIDISNPESVACMEVYQALKPFFSIDAATSDYDTILKEFMEGKTLFTIVSTDALPTLQKAVEEGSFTWEYGISLLPDLKENLYAKGLSVTDVIAVNGFAAHRDIAEDVARFLSLEADASIYEKTGHPAAGYQAEYESDWPGYCMAAYEKTAILPKIIEASNFWMQLEIAMTGIWEGEDTTASMESLQEQIRSQVR